MSQNIAKIVFVGDTRVGKTSIIYKYMKRHEQTIPTIGANSFNIPVPLDDGNTVTLSVWDTAGQEEFKCLVPMYARGAAVAVVVFDLSNKETYDNLNSWVQSVVDDYDIPNVIIVGNKNDLETFTNPDELVFPFKDTTLPFLSTSAETGSGIENLFMQIAMDSLKSQEIYKPTTTFQEKNHIDEITNKKACC